MKITFFCKVDRKALSVVEFYKQDIEILQSLGHDVKIATSYKEIDWSADIIFIWWWTYAFFPVFISKLLRKKTLITGTFNYLAPQATSDYFRRPWWQRILIKYAIKRANNNILVSKIEFELIKRDWKLKNLSYSPHIVDTEKYVVSDTNEKNKFIFSIIWTGKLNLKRKCLPEIIETAKLVIEKDQNIKFLIGGRKGDGFDYAQSMIEKSGLTNNIILLGEITEEDKIKYLQECIIYLQPSRYEGFGVAIAEAMSCGSVVITSDVGEVKNVLGDAGILLNGHDPKEISKAIFEILGDEGKRLDLEIKARKRILDNFGQDVRRNDFKKIIEKL